MRLYKTYRIARSGHCGDARLDPARPDVQIIRSAVSRKEMRQMSIGFSVPKNRDWWSEDFTKREISEVKLAETSIVWRGASPTTTANMRSLVDVLFDEAEIDEDELRRAMHARGYVLEPVAKPETGLYVTQAMVHLMTKRP